VFVARAKVLDILRMGRMDIERMRYIMAFKERDCGRNKCTNCYWFNKEKFICVDPHVVPQIPCLLRQVLVKREGNEPGIWESVMKDPRDEYLEKVQEFLKRL